MGAIIVGFGTTVGGSFAGICATSVQWGFNPNAQRLYCLGQVAPEITIQKPTETFSVTFYGDGESALTYVTTPSITCVTTNALSASVSPSACAGAVAGVTGEDWVVNSYSYSKDDPQLTGQETWSLTRWAGDDPPDIILRMSAEGEASDSGKVGITFEATQDLAEGSTGSVSAGALGRADIREYGMVTLVGNSGAGAGDTEAGSASMNYQPLWTEAAA